MKNIDILNLAKAGILKITNHTLEPKDAYKIVKFRKFISDKLNDLKEQETSILEDQNIIDPAEFDSSYNALLERKDSLSSEEKEEYENKTKTIKRIIELRSQLYEEEVDTSSLKHISYETWHALQNEKENVDILSNAVEMILEDVLWIAPEE